MKPRVTIDEMRRRHLTVSRLLTVLMFALLAGLGTVAAMFVTKQFAWIGGLVAFSISITCAVVAYFRGADWLLERVRATRMSRAQYPRLFNVVEEVSIAAGIETPWLYMIESRSANSFATTGADGRGVVVLTSGLVESLDRDEIQAVIAHEIAHITNRDTRFLTMVSFVAGIVPFVCEALWKGVAGCLDFLPADAWAWGALGIALIAAISFWLASPVFKVVLRVAISRRREFLADAVAVQFTRNPEALCRSIHRLAAQSERLCCSSSIAQFFFVDPGARSPRLLASHPSATHRVREIRRIYGTRGIIWSGSAEDIV